MLFGLLQRGHEKAAPRVVRKDARRARLEVEPLEGRLVPAAVRPLPGFNANSLAANDDGSTAAVNIGFNVNFFGVHTNQVFCNNNGNITFNSTLFAFTPFGLTGPLGQPIIAPFFADVDTRGTSNLMHYGTDTLCGHAVFGVNWIHVNYYNATTSGHVNKFNDFQLILIDRSDTGAGNFDIEFNYNSITWETGDASGGTNGLGGSSAVAGYSNGTGTPGTFRQLAGSGINGAFLNGGPDALASGHLNANTPGRFHFQVRNGQVVEFNINQGADITSVVNTFSPFRYVTTPGSQLYRGNVTVVNSNRGLNTTATDACLDEVSSSTSALAGTFQVTIIYQNLPRGVRLLNATGVTASGKPYISTPGKVNFNPGQALRFAIVLQDTGRVPLSTFLEGISFRVWGGPFDPNKA